MSSVKYKCAAIKDDVEHNSLNIIRDGMVNHAPNESTMKMLKVGKSLREKKLIIAKADKNNIVVVMDAHERIVMKTIESGLYVEMSGDPLYDMVDEVDAVLQKHKFALCKDPAKELRKWKVSNPNVPCLYLYVLLKHHKPVDGDYKGRPVACNTKAPSEIMAKNLSNIFNSLPPPNWK